MGEWANGGGRIPSDDGSSEERKIKMAPLINQFSARHTFLSMLPTTLQDDNGSLQYGSPVPLFFHFPSLDVPLCTWSPSPRLRTLTFTSFYFAHILHHINLHLNALCQ